MNRDAEIMARLARTYAAGLIVTRSHGIPDGTAAQAMLLAATAALVEVIGPAALATHLRDLADRLEVDGGAPEVH